MLSVLLGLLGFLSEPTLAHAQAANRPDDEALLKACDQSLACSSHLARANKLYEQDSYTAALDEYQAAYILQPYPLILYNIARIHHKQSSLHDAISYYQRYLDTGHPQRAERAQQLMQKARQEQTEKDVEPPPAALEIEPSPAPAIMPPPVGTVTQKIDRQTGQKSKRPVYKKWWFWTILGVTAAGAATAVGVALYARDPDVSNLPAMTFSFGN